MFIIWTRYSGNHRTKPKAEQNGLAFEKPRLIGIMEFGYRPETSR